MRLLPRTLFGQIALASFVVLLVVQLAGLWLLVDDRGRLHYKLLAEYAAQRMAGIASVLDEEDADERPALVRALSVQPTTLSLDEPWATTPPDDSEQARAFVAEARRRLARPLDVQVLSLASIDPQLAGLPGPPGSRRTDSVREGRPPLFVQTYVAQVRLHDGEVVSFRHMLPVPSTGLPYRLIALLALLGLSTTLLSVWAVRRLTRPLASFAQAANGFARDLAQPPLPESGPQEVQLAAAAFNAMQRDIRRLVDTRAQALSAVSHDLRLPITRLRLRLEGKLPPDLRDAVDRDLGEMDAMIGDTLDFLRAGSNAEPAVAVNLDALLDSVVEDMEELGAHIARSGRSSGPIQARPHALRRCLANLLDNARCYGGGEIALAVAEDDGVLRITIRDHGPGIPAADLDKVFEPYFRLEGSRARHTGGVGLGLPIARAIAEQHGGSLVLHSAPGEGVRAVLSLPRASG